MTNDAIGGGTAPGGDEAPRPAAPPARPSPASLQPAPSFQPVPGPPVKRPTGTVSWALGLIAYIGFPPFVIAVIAGLAMAIPLRGQRARGPVAAENARHAANWGFTYALGTVVCIGGAFLTLGGSSGFGARDVPDWAPPIMLTLIMVGVFGFGIAQAIASIGGTIVSSKGRVFRMHVAIPFLAPRPGEVEAAAAEQAGWAAAAAQSVVAPAGYTQAGYAPTPGVRATGGDGLPPVANVPVGSAPSYAVKPSRADELDARAAALEAQLDAEDAARDRDGTDSGRRSGGAA